MKRSGNSEPVFDQSLPFAGARALRFIIDGLSTQDYVQVFAGAVLVALLAIVFEFGLAGLQHLTVSRGLRVSARPGRRVEDAVPEVAPTAAAPPRPAG